MPINNSGASVTANTQGCGPCNPGSIPGLTPNTFTQMQDFYTFTYLELFEIFKQWETEVRNDTSDEFLSLEYIRERPVVEIAHLALQTFLRLAKK